MPSNNRFHPQQYSAEAPSASYELIVPKVPNAFDAPESQSQMRRLGERLAQARVRRIILVHGTLAGTDALGILGHLDQFLPRFALIPNFAQSLGALRKRLVDAIVGDVGNYSQDFAEHFNKSIAAANDRPPDGTRLGQSVERFLWSSENHHLGRAWAAVRLLAKLFAIEVPPGDRVLLWGHSHAGNVFAIVSNLLGGTPEDRDRFFSALHPDVASSSENAAAAFESVSDQLNDGDLSARLADSMDFVTFGTPIRYGWESNGLRRLLHFVNHRPMEGTAVWQAKYPDTVDEMRAALLGLTGDYVQQTFIAGTDFPPSILSRDARQANNALGAMLEPNMRRRDLLKRLRTGPRVAADGTTLLIDYGAGGSIDVTKAENSVADSEIGARQLAGHGVYTTLAWLPFQLNEVVKRIYNGT